MDQIVQSFISLIEKIKEGKPVDVHAKKAYCGSKGKAPLILNLWQWTSLRPGPLTPGKEFWYPLNRKLNDSQPFWTFCSKEKCLVTLHIRIPNILAIFKWQQ
jgi:hypothetical protein